MSRPDRRERRRVAAAKGDPRVAGAPGPPRGQDAATSALHEERLDAVVGVLRARGAASVLDLGCGAGALLGRLAAEGERFTRLAGVDASLPALERARQATATARDGLALHHASLTAPDERMAGFDAVTLVEAIEHVAPAELSRVEGAVFGELHPPLVIITTPNREYNELYGMPQGTLRHADHRFEWDRTRFRAWAGGVGGRHGYRVAFEDVGPRDRWRGGPTQMAVFDRVDRLSVPDTPSS